MKQVMLVVLVTILALTSWIVLQTKVVLEKTYISKNLLEISLPISGRIDVEFLSNLESK
ncbi:hypothetical protein HYV31_00450 [candidate division WWE3 bacterium]|nr:hypothetical protein [candidate division WWE3 bacterium]